MNNTMKPNFSRLSAGQGKSEARTEVYQTVQLGSTGTFDAVMCQEVRQAGRLCRLAGRNGGGVW